MEQLELPLLGRLDKPSAVPAQIVRACKTYRHAVRMAMRLSRIANPTPALIAAHTGAYKSHVTDYLKADDSPRRRSLPVHLLPAFEALVGNTLVSQWIAWQSHLTVMQEVEATAAHPLSFEQQQRLERAAA